MPTKVYSVTRIAKKAPALFIANDAEDAVQLAGGKAHRTVEVNVDTTFVDDIERIAWFGELTERNSRGRVSKDGDVYTFNEAPTVREVSQAPELGKAVFLLDLRLKKFGQSKKAAIGKVETKADKSRLRLSKKILECAEVNKIGIQYRRVRDYIEKNEIPTDGQFRRGLHLMPFTMLDDTEQFLNDQTEIINGYVDEIEPVYEELIALDEKALDDQFVRGNYPPFKVLKRNYVLEYGYVTLATPEGLREHKRDMFDREQVKLVKKMEEAAESSRIILMEQAAKIAGKIVERLSPGEDGKPKIFRDNLLEQWDEFFSMLKYKNITGDAKLQAVIDEAQAAIAGKSVASFRKDDDLKNTVKALFEDVTSKLDSMIVDKPSRQLSLDDDE